MPIGYQLTKESDHVACVVTGDATAITGLELLEVMLGACVVTGQERVLVDVRK
jgi:hypothetical protein